jgi:hypothetical protein
VYARARVLRRRTRAWACAHATCARVYDAHWVDKDDQDEDAARGLWHTYSNMNIKSMS